MIFKDLNINLYFQKKIKNFASLKGVFKDHRLRYPMITLLLALIILTLLNILNHTHKLRLEDSILKLKHKTEKLAYHLELTKQQASMPKIESSIKAVGAYTKLLTEKDCLFNINGCFLQKNKPQITLTTSKLTPHSTHNIRSFDIDFKASFDYEVFDMMQHVLSTYSKFGYTRLQEFEIEQLFESSPVVKGRFVYDQLSLNP